MMLFKFNSVVYIFFMFVTCILENESSYGNFLLPLGSLNLKLDKVAKYINKIVNKCQL